MEVPAWRRTSQQRARVQAGQNGGEGDQRTNLVVDGEAADQQEILDSVDAVGQEAGTPVLHGGQVVAHRMGLVRALAKGDDGPNGEDHEGAEQVVLLRGWLAPNRDEDAIVHIQDLLPEQKGVLNVRPRETGAGLAPGFLFLRRGGRKMCRTHYSRKRRWAVLADGNTCDSIAVVSAARAGPDKGPSSASRSVQPRLRNSNDMKLGGRSVSRSARECDGIGKRIQEYGMKGVKGDVSLALDRLLGAPSTTSLSPPGPPTRPSRPLPWSTASPLRADSGGNPENQPRCAWPFARVHVGTYGFGMLVRGPFCLCGNKG